MMRRLGWLMGFWLVGTATVWAQITVLYCNDATKTIYGYAIPPQSASVEQQSISQSEGFQANCQAGLATATMTETQWRLFQKGQLVSITSQGNVSVSTNPVVVKADQDLADAKTNLMMGKPLTQAQVDALVKGR